LLGAAKTDVEAIAKIDPSINFLMSKIPLFIHVTFIGYT
jgi:hypothetical protein